MIIIDCEQMSPEWFGLKAGTPSASGFDKIVTSKGESSKQAKDYMYQLAGERLTGARTETYQNAAMQRGIELEAEARTLFEMMEDVEIKQVGLCYPNEQKKYSCSPDGLIENSGIEIKCPLIHTHVGYLLENKLPTKYIQQVQGSMMISGFKRWFFVSYYPGLPTLILPVERDEGFISKLRAELDSFCIELEIVTKKLRELQ